MRAWLWLVLAFEVALSGCKSLECGANTIEKDGECVGTTGDPSAECGPGTTYDSPSGRCVSDTFAGGGGLCGDNTTEVVNGAGVHICVGTGGGGASCSDPLPCPPPTMPNSVSMCGRIYDLEDTRPIDDGDPSDGEPYKNLEVRVVDPLKFIPNPNTPVLARTTPDSCGRYAILNAPRPPLGLIAVAIEDLTDDSGKPVIGDNNVITGIADIVAAGDVRPVQRAWILRRSTDAAWSAAAGFPEGQTFGKMGVYIPIFISVGDTQVPPFPGTPAENVMIAVVEGVRTVKPDNDFYFDDSEPLSRRSLSATRPATGKNGTGLFVMQPGIGNFSGLGNTPVGSCWQVSQAATPVGAAFVQERTADPRFCGQ